MLVDIIVDGETVLTINTKSIEFLLKNTDKTSIPVHVDKREIRIQFRKTAE